MSRTLATTTEVARILGTKTNQVHMWHQRAHSNGFPEPVGCLLIASPRGGRPRGPIFVLEEVVEWFVNYRPKNGRRRGDRVGV